MYKIWDTPSLNLSIQYLFRGGCFSISPKNSQLLKKGSCSIIVVQKWGILAGKPEGKVRRHGNANYRFAQGSDSNSC